MNQAVLNYSTSLPIISLKRRGVWRERSRYMVRSGSRQGELSQSLYEGGY